MKRSDPFCLLDPFMTLRAQMTIRSSADDGGPDGRRSPRADVQLDARLRRREGRPSMVEILDLSTLGFRAETHARFHPGTQAWLTLPGLEAMLVTVAWTDNIRVGCEFTQPLHPAVLDRFVDSAGVVR